MKKRIDPSIYLAVCPSRELLVRVADKWAAMILISLSSSDLRFGELRRAMQGVSQKMLTQTLRNLEQDGLVLRTVFTGRPLRVDYSLTLQGKSLVNVLLPLVSWAETNIPNVLQHRKKFVDR
jgi:DNA-binding HxlR family transcriptional regulator